MFRDKRLQGPIVAPTQREENQLGFDDIFNDLPSGRIIALQFKRPKEASSTHVRFKIGFHQIMMLRENFLNRDEAFYVFSPYPTIAEFRRVRQNLLDNTAIVDMQNISIPLVVSYDLKTVKVDRTNHLDIFFTGRRATLRPRNPESASVLCPGFALGRFGRTNNFKDEFDDVEQNKEQTIGKRRIKFSVKGTCLIHVRRDRSRR